MVDLKRFSKALPGVLILLSASLTAQNPVIRDQFTADPTARVFDGRLYLYPSHDIPSPVEKLKEWFCMADYHVFSSCNLTDWTDHGVILSQNSVPWVDSTSYSMWAPDCVKKGDMYYFYFPAAPAGGEKGFRVGVAVSHSPEGPFMPMRRPIEGVSGIDPCVLVDDDGEAYIYWQGRGGLSGARLADNMMELASEPVVIGNLPDGFKEGPFMFKRDGKYYFSFPWVRDKTETLAYAMGDSPLGPFEFKGIIMDESPTGCWTNHHSVVEWQGEWYLFYHHNDLSPHFDKNRSVRIDRLRFNPDGTIAKVIPTLRGVGVSDARRKIQIDRYSAISPDASVGFIDPAHPFGGWKTVFGRQGAWISYGDVDFSDRPVSHVTVRAKAPKGGMVRICADGLRGELISDVRIPASREWIEVTVPVSGKAPSGRHDLYVNLRSGKGVEVDWIGFDALPWTDGAFRTGRYRNLFAEMGYRQEDIDARLRSVCDALFHGPERIYFEVGDSMAYISDVKNHDVRTEGMSYGMMVAVQMGEKDVFDRLWRWSRRYMQHQEGDREGYFAWSCRTDGTRNAEGSASDGELYFITSLIFASNRWGDDTGIDYLAEARRIVDCSILKVGKKHAAPLINMEHRLITFTPDSWGGRFTDPSYHVPAFYEIWAEYLGDGRADFWRDCARRSRDYLHACTHPATGLTPDYSAYDGSLLGMRRVIGDAFRFDSWRVPMNVALDYSWACADGEWQRGYADRIQDFLYSKGIDDFVDQYNIDGTDVERVLGAGEHSKLRHSVGLVATSAAISLAATGMKSREFVDRLWNSRHEPYDDGYFDAYYDGFLRLFSFMHLSGNYRIIEKTRK